ncbi:hypothetical protein [Desulfosarcina sp.]|uniref:hypothetical protein n=1 Tax=Desulfosarcina sp. TaxID=2027861 RepID=UPI003970D34E
MKKESVNGEKKKAGTRSSIAVSSETVCEDDACIGKIVKTASPPSEQESETKEKNKRSASTAMSFGGKEGCTDEACIGKS